MRSFLLFGAVIGGALALVGACGGSNGPCGGKFCDDTDGGGDATLDGASLPDSLFQFEGGGGDGGGCTVTCSGDMHDVIDCNNQVIQQCPADQGCANGTCMPACQAAQTAKSSVGCDYYAVPATDYTQTCYAVYIANTWNAPVSLTVKLGATDLTPSLSSFGYVPTGSGASLTYTALANGQVPVGKVGILFLSGSGCPKSVATSTDVSKAGTQIADMFHIGSSAPVVAYDIFPYGGGSSAVASATLLLPTSAWDTNYVATSAWSETGYGYPWIGFVAQQDGTQISIVPTAAITAGTGVAAAAQNTLTTYNLNAGQLIRFQQATDLTGSIVQSNYPIGGWGGHGCTDLEAPACDGMHQQIPPVKALSHTYVATRYRNRNPSVDEAPPWRFVGAVDGTTLTYDPPQSGAPTTLTQGQLVEWDAKGPFVVTSQDDKHPFFFGAHMTGCFVIGGYSSPVGCAGDPEFVDVIPPEQWLASYVFFTDPTYPETNLVFMRKKGNDNQFHDVTLDCMGVLTGWQNVDAAGNYQFTRADVQTGNFSKVNQCDNGIHTASSDVGFGLTVWGWGTNAASTFSEACSYAYPAGASVQPINTVVIPPVPH